MDIRVEVSENVAFLGVSRVPPISTAESRCCEIFFFVRETFELTFRRALVPWYNFFAIFKIQCETGSDDLTHRHVTQNGHNEVTHYHYHY